MKITTLIFFVVAIVIGCSSNKEKNRSRTSQNNQKSSIDSLNNKLSKINEEFRLIKQISDKYAEHGSVIKDDNLFIFNQNWEAPSKYAIILFDKAPLEFMVEFEKVNNVKIPLIYKSFLRKYNGCSIFGISLFGLTPSIYTTGLLDRSKVQCLDLGLANKNWVTEYDLREKLFYFGSRKYSYEENIGYFMDDSGTITSIRKNGEVLHVWNDFSKFLSDEIAIAERMMIKTLPKEVKDNL